MVLGPFLIFGVIALFLHGEPPYHYFYVLFPILAIVLALLFSKRKYLLWIFIFIFSLYSFKSYISNKYLELIPYKNQIEISKGIVKDAKGRKFSLKRVGPYDYFEKNYAQNYIYLMWLFGNMPVENSKIVYTIYEQGQNVYFSCSSN